MVGGNWTTENKIRPGAYINVKTNIIESNVSDRGTVLLPLARNWGGPEFITVDAETDFFKVLGYELSDVALLPVRECLKRAQTVKVWSLNKGVKAQGTGSGLTVSAAYGGTRGNDIVVNVVFADESFEVTTLLSGEAVDTQIVTEASQLQSNGFVDFSGTLNQENANIILSGGTDVSVEAADYDAFLSAAKVEDFDVMAIDSQESEVKAAVTACIKNLREDEGKCVQAVLADYPNADFEGIISVKNGVVLSDGTVLNNYKAVYWVAGATAGAAINQSNTYSVYEDSVDVDVRYLNSEIIDALQEGSFVFTNTSKGAVVEQDINTFTSFSPSKGSILRKNRVLRVLDNLLNDIQDIFNEYFLGKVNNDSDGRNLFKAQVLSYLESLQAMSAITNLDKNNDVVVTAGNDADSIVVNLAVMPVDSIEKLYMTVIVG